MVYLKISLGSRLIPIKTIQKCNRHSKLFIYVYMHKHTHIHTLTVAYVMFRYMYTLYNIQFGGIPYLS